MTAKLSSTRVRSKKSSLAQRDGEQCFYCRRKSPASDLTMDHFIPKSRGGSNHNDNLRLACSRCNNRRGNNIDWTPDAHYNARTVISDVDHT